MNPITYDAADLAATDRLGAALAETLPPGVTIALSGTLGAGKTRLVQAIAAGCGIAREDVVSPTFVLCQQYTGTSKTGTRTIYHLDAYRLRDDDEFRELGAEEYFASDGLTIIEWAEKVVDCLPSERIEIQIDVTGPDSRQFLITTRGNSLRAFPPLLAACLGKP